ncbi:hypothetical protein FRB90_002971 [Tulasnella sp. 427]|nr:hypothetical protein FRB90_002971 [Tulasnella sp. 427]
MSLAARLDPPGAKRNDRPNRHSPYTRPNRDLPPADGNWVHDKFAEINDIPAAGGALASRISGGVATGSDGAGAKLFARALDGGRPSGVGPMRRAASGGSLSIKGASAPQSTILEIKELVAGTSADDVKAIFSQCGIIRDAWTLPSGNSETTVIRVKFAERDGMLKAIKQFNGQVADGRTLSVKEVGPARQKDLIDEGMEEDNEASGSKGRMYSDGIPGGKIVSEPPKIEKLEKIDLVNDKWSRGGGRGGSRGRGGRGRGGRGRGGNNMQLD